MSFGLLRAVEDLEKENAQLKVELANHLITISESENEIIQLKITIEMRDQEISYLSRTTRD